MKHLAGLCLIFLFLSFSAAAQEYKYHVVEPGETVEEIARKYNVNKETIFKFNPDARKGVTPNTKLVVPLTKQNASTENVEFTNHRVKRKETLFSLSREYDVSIDNIKRYNRHLYSEELRRGEVIRIPVNLPKESAPAQTQKPVKEEPSGNPMDLSIKDHVVLPKETKYGISRKYNITIAELERLNPQMDTLHPGMIIKVRNGSLERVIDVEGELFTYYLVKPKETLFTLTRRFGVSKDSLVVLNPALAEGLKSGMVLKIPNREGAGNIEEYAEADMVNLENRISDYSPKNLVVMLPFKLNTLQISDTTSNAKELIRKDRVMQISLDFYSGVLMAIDSAKNLGLSTNVTFYDTEQNSGKVRSIIATNDFRDVNAVIGPILQSTIEAAAESLEPLNVPVISPLTKREAANRDNFYQTRPADERLAEVMISYISERAEGKNIIIIADNSSAAKKRKLLSAFPGAQVVDPKEGSYIEENELREALEEGRPNWVLLEASKIGIISNATSYLNSMTNKFDITLFTTNKNSAFDSDNVSNRHLSKLNFHFPSVDKEYSALRDNFFIKQYQDRYGVVPNTYAVRGFDVTYDVLLRMASAKNLQESVEEEGTTQYVENKFDYEKRDSGGYYNRAVYILSYGEDLELKVMQ